MIEAVRLARRPAAIARALGVYDAKNYQIRTDVADNGPALTALIARIRQSRMPGTIYFERGTYKFRTGVTDLFAGLTSQSVRLIGCGNGATYFKTDGPMLTSGDLLAPGRYFQCERIVFSSTAVRSGGTFVKVTGDMLIGDIPSVPLMNIEFSDCDMELGYDGVTLVDSAGGKGVCGFSWCGRGRIAPVRGFAAGGTVFDINTPNGVINTFEKVTHHETNGVASGSRALCTMRIRGSADSRMVSIESVYTQRGLIIDPGATGRAATIWFTNCIWGQCTVDAVSIAPNASADVHSLTFLGGYLDTVTGMTITGPGARSVIILGTTFLGCTTGGLKIDGTGGGVGPVIAEAVNFAGSNLFCVNVTGTANTQSIRVTAIAGSRFGANGTGILIGAGADRYDITVRGAGIAANCGTALTEPTPGANRQISTF